MKSSIRRLAAGALVVSGLSCATDDPGAQERSGSAWLYAAGPGVVYGFEINAGTGALTSLPGSPFRGGSRGGAVFWNEPTGMLWSASRGPLFRVDRATGALTALPETGALDDVRLVVDPAGRFAYGPGGSRVAAGGQDFLAYPGHVRAFAIDAQAGALRELAGSPYPAGLFPAQAWIAGRNESLLVCNEGYFGKYATAGNAGREPSLSVYLRDSPSGALAPAEGSPFAVPCGASRLASVTASGRLLLASDGESGVIDVYRLDELDARPRLASQLVEHPLWYDSFAVDAVGQWLVAAAGPQVATYAIDAAGGRLQRREVLSTGASANELRLDASERWLFRWASEPQGESQLFVHRLDRERGTLLQASPSPLEIDAARPRAIVSDAAGERLYALSRNGRLGGFRLDPQGPSLSPLPEVRAQAEAGLTSLLIVPPQP